MLHGDDCRKLCFPHHHDGLIRLNNGSFGAAPSCVLKKAQEFRDAWQSDPDGYYTEGTLNDLMETSRKRVATEVAQCHVEVLPP